MPRTLAIHCIFQNSMYDSYGQKRALKIFQLLLPTLDYIVTIWDPHCTFQFLDLGPITLTFSSLSLLVKAMHCGYFWLCFFF